MRFSALRRLRIVSVQPMAFFPSLPALEWLDIEEYPYKNTTFIAPVSQFPPTLTHLSFSVCKLALNSLRFDELFPALTELCFWRRLDISLSELSIGTSLRRLVLAQRPEDLVKCPKMLTSLGLLEHLTVDDCLRLPASLITLSIQSCDFGCCFTHLSQLK